MNENEIREALLMLQRLDTQGPTVTEDLMKHIGRSRATVHRRMSMLRNWGCLIVAHRRNFGDNGPEYEFAYELVNGEDVRMRASSWLTLIEEHSLLGDPVTV